MTTNSFLEYYLTLLAWIINNSIWGTLVDAGIFAVPFGAIIVDEWLRARGEGADEGNKGTLALARIENRLFTAYVVIVFCCIPLLNISLDTIKFDSSRSSTCGVSVPEPNKSGYATSFETIGDQSASVPLWWWMIHALSKGVTASAVAALPCAMDIREVVMEIDTSRIEDPILLQEVYDFTDDCYGVARARLFNNRPMLTEQQAYDIKWIGSEYLVNTPGYYDKAYSKLPRRNWPWNESRDAARARSANGGGYPTCKQWWGDSSIGLRARLVKSVDPTIFTRLKAWATWSSHKEMEDTTLRQIVSPDHQKKSMSSGEMFQQYGASSRSSLTGTVTHGINNTMTNVGLFVDKGTFYPKMNAIRTALPMVQAFLIMAIIISIPILLLISGYSLKVVMTITFGLFTLHFLTFWWELARWIDSSLITALYQNESWGSYVGGKVTLPLVAIKDGSVTSQVMDYVMGGMFLVLPVFFLSAMSWAGYSVGSGVSSLLTKGTSDVGAAAAKGTGVVKDIAMKAVTKGKGGK